MKNEQEMALEIGQLLTDGKGSDVCVIDVGNLNSWTNFFVIVTVSSSTQMAGLYKLVKDYTRENDLEIFEPHQKIADGNDWSIIDIGNIVIHMMSDDARKFYDLEKLWHGGEFLMSKDANHF